MNDGNKSADNKTKGMRELTTEEVKLVSGAGKGGCSPSHEVSILWGAIKYKW